jgi:hypothetical protein
MAIINKTIIIREPKKGKSDYTPINNSILQSNTMTPNEKSILVHLLSLPINFAILKGEIWKKMNIGRDAFNKAWKGLEKAGYCKSERIYDGKMLKGWLHIIMEVPNSFQTNGDSDLLNFRQSENQTIQKSVKIQKKEFRKEVVNKRSIPEKITSTPGNSVPGDDISFSEKWEMGIRDINVREYINNK